MLNIGLIGKLTSIEKQIDKLKKYPDIRIQGKSSVGTKSQPTDYRFSIPEYNRIELIERSDAILLEDSSLIPYSLIKDSVKRRKHIFFLEYPDFDEDQCQELIKLIEEAGTTVQIKNPLYFNSSVQYMVHHTTTPFYLKVEILKKLSETQNNRILWDITLLILKMGQHLPQKIKTIHTDHPENIFKFRNIRLEYSDSSVLELNLIFSDNDEKFLMEAISRNDIFELNLVSNQISAKSGPVNTKGFEVIKEYESFFKSVIKKQMPFTGINDYMTVLKTLEKINAKINIASL